MREFEITDKDKKEVKVIRGLLIELDEFEEILVDLKDKYTDYDILRTIGWEMKENLYFSLYSSLFLKYNFIYAFLITLKDVIYNKYELDYQDKEAIKNILDNLTDNDIVYLKDREVKSYFYSVEDDDLRILESILDNFSENKINSTAKIRKDIKKEEKNWLKKFNEGIEIEEIEINFLYENDLYFLYEKEINKE